MINANNHIAHQPINSLSLLPTICAVLEDLPIYVPVTDWLLPTGGVSGPDNPKRFPIEKGRGGKKKEEKKNSIASLPESIQ
jgi:hypothetical protein